MLHVYCVLYVLLLICVLPYNWLFMRPRDLSVLAPKGNFKMYANFIYAYLLIYTLLFYAVYINYANYICMILVLLVYSHKYSARINNQLYGICL